MKDSYSFDLDDAGPTLVRRIGRRTTGSDVLDLRYAIVSAVAGAMGGSQSEEFLAEAESARTPTSVRLCGYAANTKPSTAARRRADRPRARRQVDTRRTRRPSTRSSPARTRFAAGGRTANGPRPTR